MSLEECRDAAVGDGQAVPAAAAAAAGGRRGAGEGGALAGRGVGVPQGDEGVAEEAAGAGALCGVAAEAEAAEVDELGGQARRQHRRRRVLGHVPEKRRHVAELRPQPSLSLLLFLNYLLKGCHSLVVMT